MIVSQGHGQCFSDHVEVCRRLDGNGRLLVKGLSIMSTQPLRGKEVPTCCLFKKSSLRMKTGAVQVSKMLPQVQPSKSLKCVQLLASPSMHPSFIPAALGFDFSRSPLKGQCLSRQCSTFVTVTVTAQTAAASVSRHLATMSGRFKAREGEGKGARGRNRHAVLKSG